MLIAPTFLALILFLSRYDACTDALLLREGLKLARKLGQTQPLNASISSEVSPGASVSTDADWDAWIPGQVGTEWVFIYVVV